MIVAVVAVVLVIAVLFIVSFVPALSASGSSGSESGPGAPQPGTADEAPDETVPLGIPPVAPPAASARTASESDHETDSDASGSEHETDSDAAGSDETDSDASGSVGPAASGSSGSESGPGAPQPGTETVPLRIPPVAPPAASARTASESEHETDSDASGSVGPAASESPQTLKLISFNIEWTTTTGRLSKCVNLVDKFINKLINEYDPDIFATQEYIPSLNDQNNLLTNYEMLKLNPYELKDGGNEYMHVFYKQGLNMERIQIGSFEPGRPFMICRLNDLLLINVHPCHKIWHNNTQQPMTLHEDDLTKIQTELDNIRFENNVKDIIVMGDFNRNMKELTLTIQGNHFHIINSKSKHDESRLTCCRSPCNINSTALRVRYAAADHILYSRNTLADAECSIIDLHDNPSDHLPIYLEITAKPSNQALET